MKITIFNLKGGQGKTTISLALALNYGFFVVTNDEYSPIEKVLPRGKIKHIAQGQILPVVPDNVNLIYDFGGYPDKRLIEAVSKSDKVIIPVIYDSALDMQTTIKTIREIEKYNKNIIIVVNRTHKGVFEKAQAILDNFIKYPMFEVKQSTAFVKMVDTGKSIPELMAHNVLLKYHYKAPAEQIEAIKSYLDKE